MKKLFIAFVSAVSFALLAKADPIDLASPTGTSFENAAAGAFSLEQQDEDGSSYWYSTGDEFGQITEGAPVYSGDRPAMFQNATQLKYFEIDSADRLYRSASALPDGGEAQPVNIGAGVYFDSLVRFAAAEAGRAPEAGDKIGLWFKAVAAEDDPNGVGVTNLMVKAAYLEEDNSVTVKDYAITTLDGNAITAADNLVPDSWHRVTIKALADASSVEGSVGFVVFIDDKVAASDEVKGDDDSFLASLNPTALAWADKDAFFPSMVAAGTEGGDTITSAAFLGVGAVDDVSFTPNAPTFAADSRFFTVKWDPKAFNSLTVNGQTNDVADGTCDIEGVGNEVAVVCELVDNYVVTGAVCDANSSFDLATMKFTLTGTSVATLLTQKRMFKVGDNYYETFEKALEAAEDGGTVQLAADIELEEPLSIEDMDITIDLAGHDITICAANDPAIGGSGEANITIIDSIGGGEVSNTDESDPVAVYTEGSLTIGAYEGDMGASFNAPVDADGDLLIISGKFLADGPFAYEDSVDENSTVSDEAIDGYWVVTAGEPPVVDSYKVSWEPAANATTDATVDEVGIDNPSYVEIGKTVVFTVEPDDDYEFADEEYEGWEITEAGNLTRSVTIVDHDVEITIPEPTEVEPEPETVQIQLPIGTAGVAGYIVSNLTEGVAIAADDVVVVGGATYTLPLGKKVEIWVVPADGYRVTGNPYTIDEVTTETTVEVTDLPSVAAIPYVAQIGDARFETLQEAFASEAEGDIVLLDNVTLTETLSVNKDFVLNLGGKTLTSTLPSVAWAIRLGDSAAITAVISNGTIVANQYGVRANQTDLTLDTVTIDSTLRALQSTTASDIDLVGCTISAAPNAEDEIAILTKGGMLDLVDTTVNSGAKGLDLSGTVATIDADSVISVDGVNCAVFVGSEAGVKTQLTVAGKIEATASHTSDNDSIYAISGNGTDADGADVTIAEGADISVTADETAIYWPNAGTLTVNGGSITGGTAIWAKSGNVVVNGGEISANGAAAPYAEDNDGVTPTGDAIVFEKLSGDATGYPNNLTASITGGTITSENGKAVVSVAREGETALAGFVSGGTFSSPIPEEFCASGFIPMANDDGTYGVKEGAYVAQVGAVKYETVEAALAAVQALETAGTFPIVITALADDGLTITDTDRTASIEKDVTITIPSVGSWVVSGVLTYSGVIEGTVAAADIVILDGGSITLGVNALVTVGLASELKEDSFIAPDGYEVEVMATMDAKSFKVVEIPTYAITWTAPENATVVAIDEEGDEVESGDEYSKGCEIVFTVTPKENYTYTGVELGTAWTLLESGAISNLVTMGAEPVAVTIPEAVAAAPAWDIPGAEGGINALVKEDGTKYVEFTSVTFTATGATVGLHAKEINANGQDFGLVCKTDITKGDTFVINATLNYEQGELGTPTEGLFTITADLSGYDQLFVVGVGPADDE